MGEQPLCRPTRARMRTIHLQLGRVLSPMLQRHSTNQQCQEQERWYQRWPRMLWRRLVIVGARTERRRTRDQHHQQQHQHRQQQQRQQARRSSLRAAPWRLQRQALGRPMPVMSGRGLQAPWSSIRESWQRLYPAPHPTATSGALLRQASFNPAPEMASIQTKCDVLCSQVPSAAGQRVV